ncbi:MAG: DUF1684 domain-containing protein [Leeuwenhoekiella sp.]
MRSNYCPPITKSLGTIWIVPNIDGIFSRLRKNKSFTQNIRLKQPSYTDRHLDRSIPESNSIVIDFNKANNLYCAYSSGYSCPIPPLENRLLTKRKRH